MTMEHYNASHVARIAKNAQTLFIAQHAIPLTHLG